MAFERAKAADTVASYMAYLAEFPSGRHVAEAKERLKAARVREAAAAGEKALALTPEQQVLVERGLASVKSGGGKRDGQFDATFRGALRSWQALNGNAPTGYLTREQSEVLIAAAREIDERERDDAAFERAKAADTSAAYEAYLAKYPNGRHVAEARRRLEAARAGEERRKKELEAERIRIEEMEQERAQCMAAGRSRLTAGTVFCDCPECPLLVVGKDGSAVSKYSLTRAEWNACIEDRACGRFRRRGEASQPMDAVNLEKARAYVTWLRRKTGRDYRLENESQWTDDSLLSDSLGGRRYENQILVSRTVKGTASAGTAADEQRLGLSRSDRMLIQRALNAGGFDAGVVDGVFGRRTRDALRGWQRSNGYRATGYLTAAQVEALRAAQGHDRRNRAEQMERLSELLGRPASAGARDEVGWSDLHYAAVLDLPGAVAALVEAGTPVDVRLNGDDSPFGDRLIRTLTRTGLGDRFKGWKANRQTPLMFAAIVKARDAFTRLVELGADTSARTPIEKTPLHYAAQGGALFIAKFLADRGADLNAQTDKGSTPLHLAAGYGGRDVTRFLVERGADLNARSDKGTTPLHWAARRNAREAAWFLVERGADIHARNGLGRTPLHSATMGDARKMVRYLVDLGADVNAIALHSKDYEDGRTPYDLTVLIDDETKRAEMRRLLRSLGGRSAQ